MPIKSVDFPTSETVHFVFAKTLIKNCGCECSLWYSSFPQSKNKHAKVVWLLLFALSCDSASIDEGVSPICVLAVKLSENVHVFIEKGRKSPTTAEVSGDSPSG